MMPAERTKNCGSLLLIPFFLTSVVVIRSLLQRRRLLTERLPSGRQNSRGNSYTSSDKEQRMMSSSSSTTAVQRNVVVGSGEVKSASSSLLAAGGVEEADTIPLTPIKSEAKSLGLKVVEVRSTDEELQYLTPVSSSLRLAAPIVSFETLVAAYSCIFGINLYCFHFKYCSHYYSHF